MREEAKNLRQRLINDAGMIENRVATYTVMVERQPPGGQRIQVPLTASQIELIDGEIRREQAARDKIDEDYRRKDDRAHLDTAQRARDKYAERLRRTEWWYRELQQATKALTKQIRTSWPSVAPSAVVAAEIASKPEIESDGLPEPPATGTPGRSPANRYQPTAAQVQQLVTAAERVLQTDNGPESLLVLHNAVNAVTGRGHRIGPDDGFIYLELRNGSSGDDPFPDILYKRAFNAAFTEADWDAMPETITGLFKKLIRPVFMDIRQARVEG